MRKYNCAYCNRENKYRGIQYANKYCDNKCQAEHQKKLKIENWLNNIELVSNRPTIRTYLTELKGYKCEVCGISKWNNNPITLQVDHKDGNAGNNCIDNVRLICPNCHSQQATWGGRNKGNGRAARGLPLY